MASNAKECEERNRQLKEASIDVSIIVFHNVLQLVFFSKFIISGNYVNY